MKILNGFHKKNYFSLSAILAFAVCSSLHAQNSSVDELNNRFVNEDKNIPTFTVIKRIKVAQSAIKEDANVSSLTNELSIISKDQINSQHQLSVADIIQANSSIYFSSNGMSGQSTNFYLRGLDSSKVLVLVDGIKYSDPTSIGSSADLSNLYLNNIEKIEILKGSNSVVWGDASGGVINIITDSSKSGFSGNLDIMKGSFDTNKIGANVNYSNDKIDIILSSAHLKSDALSAQTPYGDDASDYENDEYTNHTNSIKVAYKIDNHNKISVQHNNVYSYGDADPFGNPNGENPFVNKNQLYKASYQYKDSKYNLHTYVSQNKFQRYYPTGWTSSFVGEIEEIGIDTSVKYSPKSLFKVGFTKEKKSDRGTNQILGTNSLFVLNSNEFKNVILSEGIRYDDSDTFDDKFTYNIGIKTDINDIFIGANYSTSYKQPSLYQLYDGYSGNSTLNPENIKSFDIYVQAYGASISYFDTKIDDMIEWTSTGTYTGEYQNIDKTSKIRGIEITQNMQYKDMLSLDLSFVHLLKAKSANNRLYRRARNRLSATISTMWGPSSLDLMGTYIGTRYDSAFNPVQTGRYTKFDIVYNYKINKNFSTYIKLDNITDKYYQNAYGYSTSSRAGYLGFKANF